MKRKAKRNLQGFLTRLFICALLLVWLMLSIKDFVSGVMAGYGSDGGENAALFEGVLFTLTAVFVIVLIIGLFLLLKKFVFDPVKRLSASMEKVRGGDLNVTMDVADRFEFGKMEESFNTMVQGLREAKELQSTNEEKNRKLYAEIAHDLKTPMTMILGYAKLLSQGDLSEEEKKEHLGTIIEQTEHANALLEQMLEYAKLGSTEYRLDIKEGDLAECLRQVAAESYYRFEEKKMELDVEIPDEAVLSQYDERQIKRVFFNLIGNVITHNPEGIKVKIVMKLPDNATNNASKGRDHETTQEFIEIWVADNGPLIEEGLKDQLFEPFHAGEASYHRKGGSGLGLSVARKIARLHGGDLEYRERLTEEFKGFVLTLPRK